jgi:hypothetical protein
MTWPYFQLARVTRASGADLFLVRPASVALWPSGAIQLRDYSISEFCRCEVQDSPDCGPEPFCQSGLMTSPFIIELSAAEKLAALRAFDRFREWKALEDKRCCLCCGHVITGAQIRVVGPPPFQLECPTEGCRSIPMDWVMPRATKMMEEPKAKMESFRHMEELRARASVLTRPPNTLRQIIGALLISHFRQ